MCRPCRGIVVISDGGGWRTLEGLTRRHVSVGRKSSWLLGHLRNLGSSETAIAGHKLVGRLLPRLQRLKKKLRRLFCSQLGRVHTVFFLEFICNVVVQNGGVAQNP